MVRDPNPSKRIAFIVAMQLIGLLLIVYGASSTVAEAATALQRKGDPVRGGLLYDEWWVVVADDHEAKAPEGDHPLWATQSTNTRSGADTWRCKECHGWDYKGVEGAYGSGSHKTGFIGVFNSRAKPVDQLMAAMKGGTNPKHDFSKVMGEQDLVDLVTFMSQALIDPNTLLASGKTSKGNADNGKKLYGQVCTYCHGPNGTAINFDTIAEPEFLECNR
jgi:thiosulfate dehydrogenase